MLGIFPFEYHLIIPRGIIYQIQFETEDNRFTSGHLLHTQNGINESGQHLEHSPFCERDFILPTG
jgi:homogentisate 1,2-dioxygenase